MRPKGFGSRRPLFTSDEYFKEMAERLFRFSNQDVERLVTFVRMSKGSP